jgi:hypothetical protein
MKKIFTFAFALGLTVASYAQVQRMVLSEEFTNASCGPCASQNPAYNALLDANTTKVVSIKYQTVWPGVDPMNAQNTTDAATRVTYYGVNGVPYAPMDGDTNVTGPQAYNGAPFNYNQAMIDARYAVPAHWSISLSHTLNANLDSIFITCVVTPDATNPSITGLKLHLALIEKTIRFNSAPGTNGETEFYNVMRKMYPSAAGQNLDAANATGAFTYTVAAKIPTYIYDKSQIGVVAFVQNNTHTGTAWPVEQAAISQPVPLQIDGAITALTPTSSIYTCSSTSIPTFTLKNPGLTALTSATITYKVDNGAIQTYNYSGSLAAGAEEVITLPSFSLTVGGAHTFTTTITNVNGSVDNNSGNNTLTRPFIVFLNTTSATSHSQDFATDVLTNSASGYAVSNPDNAATWTRATTLGGMMKMNFYNSPDGEEDNLILPYFATTGATVAQISFDYTHAQYNAADNDVLALQYSTNCGASWTDLWSKSGTDLAGSIAVTTSAFTPTSASQFTKAYVNIPSSLLGQSNVIMRFNALSNYGNNAYVDNINIYSTVGVNDISNNNSLSVFPNPFKDNATLKLNISKSENVSYTLVSAMGAVVGSENKGKLQAGESLITIDGSNLAAGIYLMNVTVGNKTYSQKLNIVK